VLACCHILDTCFTPANDGKATILIDSRPHEGWENVSAHKMIPFFR
jgi:hypothetical protein